LTREPTPIDIEVIGSKVTQKGCPTDNLRTLRHTELKLGRKVGHG